MEGRESMSRFCREKTDTLLSAGVVIEKPNVSWDEIKGCDDAKETLKERVVLPGKFPLLFPRRALHGGILLFGPYGTGKSTLVNAVATETNNATLITVQCVDLAYMRTQVDPARLMPSVFEMAKHYQPCVIYIDEINALFPRNYEGCTTEAEYLRRMKTEFLALYLNLTVDDNGLFVIASTTKPWMLDAFVRRKFPYRTYIPLPDAPARADVFKMKLGNMAHSLTDEQINQLAAYTEGYSGTDISIVVRNALMEPARKVQTATYFRKVCSCSQNDQENINSGPDPDGTADNRFTPCSSAYPGAEAITFDNIPIDKLKEPCIEMKDILQSLQTHNVKVDSDSLAKMQQFYDDFVGF